jgi:hypothetical protein
MHKRNKAKLTVLSIQSTDSSNVNTTRHVVGIYTSDNIHVHFCKTNDYIDVDIFFCNYKTFNFELKSSR